MHWSPLPGASAASWDEVQAMSEIEPKPNPMTFWAQETPGIRYLRCETPAKELGCKVYHVDAVRWTGLSFEELNEGVAIWQILCNGSRLNIMRQLLSAGMPCYMEVDDNYTNWDESAANASWTPEMPTDPNQASLKLHRYATEMMDGVICSTEPLAEVYSKLNENVYVCRNSLDLSDWKPKLPRTDDKFRILWMASGSHKVDRKLVMPALEWASEQPGVEVYLLGPRVSDLPNVYRIPWLHSQQEYRDKMIELKPDVGICAIRDNAFSRCKSDIKVLEYSLCGALPIVSPLPPYNDWLETVPTARNGAEWMKMIKWCIDHKDEVKERADYMYDFVTTHRTITTEAQSWLDAVDAPLRELEGVA